jgi:hypothetical protein
LHLIIHREGIFPFKFAKWFIDEIKNTMDHLFDICSLRLIQFLLNDDNLRVLKIQIRNLNWQSELFFDGVLEVCILTNADTTVIEFKNHQQDTNRTKVKQFDNLTMFRIYLLKKRIKLLNYRLSLILSL